MNPQYMPPQFGALPNFQPNRSSPLLGQPSSETFQNVPLGGSDSTHMDVPPTNMKSNQFPPVGATQIPTSQLPPSQVPDTSLLSNNPFNQPSSKIENLPPTSGLQQVQNGPAVFQNGSLGITFFITL